MIFPQQEQQPKKYTVVAVCQEVTGEEIGDGSFRGKMAKLLNAITAASNYNEQGDGIADDSDFAKLKNIRGVDLRNKGTMFSEESFFSSLSTRWTLTAKEIPQLDFDKLSTIRDTDVHASVFTPATYADTSMKMDLQFYNPDSPHFYRTPLIKGWNTPASDDPKGWMRCQDVYLVQVRKHPDVQRESSECKALRERLPNFGKSYVSCLLPSQPLTSSCFFFLPPQL